MPIVRRLPSRSALAALLMLTACGGSDDSGSTTSTTSTPTPSPTPTPTSTTGTSAAANLVGTGASQGSDTAAVVTAANAFLATLGTTQKTQATTTSSSATVLFPLTKDNAIQWTNLPGDRHGLRLNASNLTTAQLTAAENLMATALSTAGKGTQDEIRGGDDVLSTHQSGYGSSLYSIAILGTPSTTSAWMLQIVGHHLAYNIMYNSTYVSGSPAFLGVEPPNWVVSASGTVSVNGSVTASSTGTPTTSPRRSRTTAATRPARCCRARTTTWWRARAGTRTAISARSPIRPAGAGSPIRAWTRRRRASSAR